MAKTLKSATELLQLLNTALRKHDACNGVIVTSVYPAEHPDGSCNWDTDMLTGSGVAVTGDCRLALIAERFALQKLYDLETDE
jgi:hypothetical protein